MRAQKKERWIVAGESRARHGKSHTAKQGKTGCLNACVANGKAPHARIDPQQRGNSRRKTDGFCLIAFKLLSVEDKRESLEN
jgi:hypothetical protein